MRSLRERYESGEGCREIAEDIGCSPSTVWLRLKKQGVTFRPRGGKEVVLDIAEAKRLYRTGMSCLDLAKHFGCSTMVVWRRLVEAGVELRPSGGTSKLDDADVCERYALGQSAHTVARQMGCTHVTILRHLREEGVTIRPAAEALTLNLDTETIQKAYEDGLALSTIAKQMGCSRVPIRSRLADLDVTPRPRASGPRIPLDEDELIRLYLKGIPSTALQGTFGCSYATILKRLRSLGIEVRGSGSYSRKDGIDVDTLVDLYLEGWAVDRVAAHLGCSAHLVRNRLDERGVERRSGSPHGGICIHKGVVVKTDSGWEAHVFGLLREQFRGALRFQGEFGQRSHLRTRSFNLNKPKQVRAVYLPHRAHYRWTPDFYIPELGLHLEVKGWHARKKWDSVIVPSILHSQQPARVAVLTDSPYRMRTWAVLASALHYVT